MGINCGVDHYFVLLLFWLFWLFVFDRVYALCLVNVLRFIAFAALIFGTAQEAVSFLFGGFLGVDLEGDGGGLGGAVSGLYFLL
jgi:hypothetical protein